MGRIIAVIGNSGVGKTTLTMELCRIGSFMPFLEQHETRPFQEDFMMSLKENAFKNQVDYLLFRAEQEYFIRRENIVGVQDGGLDQDFHVFTRLFLKKGYLNDKEYKICERLYKILRSLLQYPDVIVKLQAPVDTLEKRRHKRDRKLDIVTSDDLAQIEVLISGWTNDLHNIPVILVDASKHNPGILAKQILGKLTKAYPGIRLT